MDPHKFMHPISVRSGAETEDAVGQISYVWSEFVARRAARETKGARRWWSDPQFLVEIKEVFVVRLCATTEQITETMRVIFKGRELRIESVVIDYEERVVVIGCAEIKENAS